MPPDPAGRRRYGLLLIVTFISVGVQGIASPGDVQQIVVASLAGASVLLALRAAQVAPSVIRFAAAAVLIVLGLSIAKAIGVGIGEGPSRIMNAALIVVGAPAVALGVIRDLRTTRRVRREAVMGVLSLYLLLGMFFAFLYGAVDRLGGDPFFTSGNTATVSHCVYFSFTTLSTVGYGDFVARTDTGHTLAVFEMMVGQIYLVTVVSLIVGNLGRSAPRQPEA